MAEVLLFHHAHGLTPGVHAFAEGIRGAGHLVHLPDLYEGRVFATLEEGVAYVQELGFANVLERGVQAARTLPSDLVYAGFSLGAMPAQKLAQTRPGARGALLFEACVPVEEFGESWPERVPVQVHGMAEDEFFAGDGDLEAARKLVESAPPEAAPRELHLYQGGAHLFADPGLPGHDPAAAALVLERALRFLDRLG